jgi:hypothetical protein
MQMMGQKPTGVMGTMRDVMQGGINAGGMGQAAPTPRGMGQASPMGPTGETESIMEGLRQLGKYAQGGCV